MIKLIGILFLLTAAGANAQDYGEWSALLGKNDAWFASDAQAITIGDLIVQYQLSDGGWRKGQDVTSGEWSKSTVDNDATTSQIIFLARLYKARNTAKYLTSLQKGIDLFLNNQYSNGGFPQIFSASSGSYHTHITFNDGAMVKIMDILLDASLQRNHFTVIDNSRAAKAKTAVEKGVDVILNSQIVFTNGTKTAWCQQHDRNTLAPASARAYELPSVSGSESVGIVDFLKRYHTSLGNNPRVDVVQAINAAVTWMTNVRIVGYKVENITTDGAADRVLVSSSSSDTLWARFYELDTNKPMFVGRDGVKKYSMAEIEQERRAGYAWYGTWPRGLVRAGLMTVPTTNTPPTASVTIPTNNSIFMPGQTINITANAADANGTISKVEFFNGSVKLGEVALSPYAYSWENPPAGVHRITARATDNGNATGTSSAVTVTVGALIGSDDFIDSLVTFDPENAAAYSINKNFSAGSKVFGDREFVVGLSVPASLLGADWVSTSMETRKLTLPATLIRFKMKKTGFINLLLEDRVADKPAWVASGGFTATNSKISVNDGSADRSFTVYTKSVNQGDVITMGINSNNGTTSSMMYLMAFTNEATMSILSPVQSTHFSVRSINGKTLLVEVSTPTVLDIFNLVGKKVASYNVSGSQTLNLKLQNGVYLAKTRGMQSAKFTVLNP